MKNTLIIPDLHGRTQHKDLINKHTECQRVIYLGDYFDSWDVPYLDQINNFLDIISLKEKGDIEVIMLIGNHDFYIPNMDTNWSGYQSLYAPIIWQAIKPNLHHLQIAYRDEEYLFSHAGISCEFINKLKFAKGFDYPENIDDIIDVLNDYLIYKPEVFNFGYFQETISCDESGDDIWQGPTWIRPRALKMANYDHWLKDNFIQIVGHTGVDNIDFKGKSTGGRYYFVDTMHNKKFEYLTIINGELKLNKYENN